MSLPINYPINVLHFGRFFNNTFGGVERFVSSLTAANEGKVCSTNVVANESFQQETIHTPPCDIFKLPSLGVAAGTALCPTMPFFVRRLHAEKKFDIAHLHFPDPMSHLAAYFLPPSVKIVISSHSEIIKQKRLLRVYQPFLTNIYNRADAIVGATPTHLNTVQMAGVKDRSKFHVIPYGLDYTSFINVSDSTQALSIRGRYPGKSIVFSLGRHVYYKGFEYLIRAMNQLPDAILILGGSGPLTAEYKELAATIGVAGRVVFEGRIPDEDLPAYYHAADVFCLPSVERAEAFGLVQLEAMSCKKPVVSCALGTGVDYVNQDNVTGLVVEPRDVDGLATALQSLFDHPELRQAMGTRGFERATDHYSVARMAQETLCLYESLLG